MTRLIVTGQVVALVGAVVAFVSGAPVLGFAALSGGFALVTVAARRARPANWTPSENDPEAGERR